MTDPYYTRIRKPIPITQFEGAYFRTGFFLALSGPIQLLLFYALFMKVGPDLFSVYPLGVIIGWAVPSVLFHTIVARLAIGRQEDIEAVKDSLGITGFVLFAFHAGILMMTRVAFVAIVRIFTNNREWRRNEFYILWHP